MNIRWKMAQAAEIRWWKHYLKNRTVKGYLENKAAYWRRVLRAAGVEPVSGERILDAGCGPAGIFIILDGQEVDAVDPLLEAYQANLPHFSQDNYRSVTFFTEALESFSARHSYDTIFCLNAINHVADLGRCLDVLTNALKPGGRLLLSVDTHKYFFIKKLFQWLPGDVLHPHQYSLEEYRQMLEARGLAVQRTVPLKQGAIFDYFLLVAQH